MKKGTLLVLLVAACSGGDPAPGRLDFLLAQDASRAYVVDSAWTPENPLTPPYEAGLNQITVLRGVNTGAISVEQTFPLGGPGYLMGLSLSPDGDTALVARENPAELIVVRGLSTGSLYVQATLPLRDTWNSTAISPDGTWALVGNLTLTGPLTLQVVAGLPENPAIVEEIDLGPDYRFGCGDVKSIQIRDDGAKAVVLLEYSAEHDWPFNLIPTVAQLRVIKDPGPTGVQRTVDVLDLPLESVLPAPPALAGHETSRPGGDFAVMCDGDTVLVAMMGAFQFGAPDARVIIVRGLANDRMEIARILTPDDGIDQTPFLVTRLPDCDRVVVTHLRAGKLSLISGLRDPTFATVKVKSIPTSRALLGAALTPDGKRLLVDRPRPPQDNRDPAAILQFEVRPDTLIEGEPVFGPVRTAVNSAQQLATFRPALSDYIALCTAHLPPPVNASMQDRIVLATRLADGGRDEVAVETLRTVERDVRALVDEGKLFPVEAKLVGHIVDAAEARLR